MSSSLPYRLYAFMRQMLLLCAVVGSLAPQMSIAMTGEGAGACAVLSMCYTVADASDEPCNMDRARMETAGDAEDCASMACYCTMPFSMSEILLNGHIVIAASTPQLHITSGGINPALLRKPPKYL